jgi:hypothetical protein
MRERVVPMASKYSVTTSKGRTFEVEAKDEADAYRVAQGALEQGEHVNEIGTDFLP